ncbi:MAG: hypothetical protein ACLS3M_01790 [Collinsella sp.]
MSIKRLALCRSQGRLFVLLRFAGQDVAALIEREGSQAFVHATTSGSRVPSLVLPVDHGRVLALCPSVSGYERELAVMVLPFLDGSSMDVVFASGGQRLGSIRLDSRVAKLESKINYKAKPALCALIRDAQRGECCVATRSMPFAICRQTPARCGAMRLPGRETPVRTEFQISDTHMNAIDVTVHVFESQVDVPQQDGCRVNKTFLSVEMPQDIRDLSRS